MFVRFTLVTFQAALELIRDHKILVSSSSTISLPPFSSSSSRFDALSKPRSSGENGALTVVVGAENYSSLDAAVSPARSRAGAMSTYSFSSSDSDRTLDHLGTRPISGSKSLESLDAAPRSNTQEPDPLTRQASTGSFSKAPSVISLNKAQGNLGSFLESLRGN